MNAAPKRFARVIADNAARLDDVSRKAIIAARHKAFPCTVDFPCNRCLDAVEAQLAKFLANHT